jgi:hypothetical protein
MLANKHSPYCSRSAKCQCAMAHPQVADRVDVFQMLKVATSRSNKQSRTVDSGRSSSMGVGPVA